MRRELNLKMIQSQHYAKLSRMLSDHKFAKLGKAGVLLGARFGALNDECDNCKTELKTYTIVVMKPIPPRHYHTIHVLCETCRLLHADEVKYYLYLNK